MKKIKVVISSLLLAMILLVSSCSAQMAEDMIVDLNGNSYFMSFTGIVKDITLRVDADGNELDGSSFVLVENSDGALMNFIVSKDTYMVTEGKLEVGAKVAGYYYANRPAILIYPPQQNAVVLEVNPPITPVAKVDRFDSNLVSADNDLKIISTERAEIVDQNNAKYTGSLQNRNLVVIYDISTSSIPAQTSPLKIVVLNEEDDFYRPDVSQMEIVVENKRVEAPNAYYNKDGYVMVPLRAIAQALGFDIKWDNVTKTVSLGNTITLQVGRDYYTYAKMAPIYLGAAPENRNGVVYVPLSFFKQVARQNNAYVFEGQIVVDNGEEMI